MRKKPSKLTKLTKKSKDVTNSIIIGDIYDLSNGKKPLSRYSNITQLLRADSSTIKREIATMFCVHPSKLIAGALLAQGWTFKLKLITAVLFCL